MENLKLIFADGTEIDIDEFHIPMHIVIIGTRERLVELWSQMTSEAMERVTVSINGSTLMVQQHATLDNVQFIKNNDCQFTGHFYIGGETIAADSDYTMAAKILLGEVE